MKTLNINQVIDMHSILIQRTGGLDDIRDKGLLDSALMSAHQTFDGINVYPTTIEKCTRICFSIVNNHPFVDGNKRIGLLVMLTLFKLNNIEIKYTQDELIKLGLGLASGSISYDDLLSWVKERR